MEIIYPKVYFGGIILLSKKISKDVLLIGIILLLLGTGFCYGYLYRNNSLTNSLKNESGEGKALDNIVTEEFYPENVTVPINQLSYPLLFRIHWVCKYEKCDHTVTFEENIEIEKDKISQEALIARFPDSTVLNLSNTEALMEKRIRQFCPQHFILKSDNNSVGIYKNKVGTDILIKQQTLSVQNDHLDDELRKRIEEGIPFESLEEIEGFLEDIDS